MPLPTTHIKYALDVKDRYEVSNLAEYISGTVYPDSRYFTGIDRNLTHNNNLLAPDFATSDFKKGWVVHFLCDKAGNQAKGELFAELLSGANPNDWGTPAWVIKTGLKVVNDIILFKKFDVQPYLAMLNYVESPNGEAREDIESYHQVIRNAFGNKKEVTVVEVKEMWLSFGLEDDMVDSIIQATENILADSEKMSRFDELYGRMVALHDTLSRSD